MTDTTATLTADQRASKVAKITALLQKTEANGCTADEATAAKAMADRLCDQYGISASECQPVTSRRPSAPTGDWFADMMRDSRAKEQARRSSPEGQRQAQEQARAGYRRAGVHIDRDDEGNQIQHPDCQCSGCRAFYGSTAPKAPTAGTGSTGRRNTSHKDCGHENTSSARARCRKNRGY